MEKVNVDLSAMVGVTRAASMGGIGARCICVYAWIVCGVEEDEVAR